MSNDIMSNITDPLSKVKCAKAGRKIKLAVAQEVFRKTFQSYINCVNLGIRKIVFIIGSGREGTLDCKLHWYPKFFILVGLRTLALK